MEKEALRVKSEELRLERQRRRAAEAKARDIAAQLPKGVRKALEAKDEAQFEAALASLSPAEQQAVITLMQKMMEQTDSAPADPDMTEVLRRFEPLLRAIAAVAQGDAGPRQQVEDVLPKLEQNGWQLTEAVAQLWRGERDAATLTANLDENSAALVKRVLELVVEAAV